MGGTGEGWGIDGGLGPREGLGRGRRVRGGGSDRRRRLMGGTGGGWRRGGLGSRMRLGRERVGGFKDRRRRRLMGGKGEGWRSDGGLGPRMGRVWRRRRRLGRGRRGVEGRR